MRGIMRIASSRRMSRYLRIAHQEIFEEESENLERSETMQKEEILRILINCGLNEYESRAYASLVFLGPSKATDVSKDSMVPQSKIYNVLDQLMNKQLVEMFDGRPKEFKAVEPAVALKNLLDEKMIEITAIKEQVEKMSDYLKPTKPSGEVLSGVWTIKGKKWREFFNKSAEMVDRSEKYVYGVTRDYSRSASLADAVRRCTKRGVKVCVIGMETATKENYQKVKWYKEHGIDVRVFETKVHPRIILVDGREVLLRLDQEPKKKSGFKFASLWSDDPSLVRVMDSYVKNLWTSAQPVKLKKTIV